MTARRLAPDEAALWKRVIENVKPMHPVQPVLSPVRVKEAPPPRAVPAQMASPPPPAKPRVPAPAAAATKAAASPSNTLDGSWDRRLSRGLVAPESSVDLHGHTLASAYDRLDRGLDAAILHGDRVLLLVTGKPPGPQSERPHARGAIRAAVGDWLAASRHANHIAAVRTAHPRHGGAGALYIILRRPRAPATRKS